MTDSYELAEYLAIERKIGGLQEGQVLKATPLYGAALGDPTLFYYQEQLKVTTHSEIVVKLTADNPHSMSAEYGTTVRDLVAFYHWHFTEALVCN